MISVIIATCKRAAALKETLDSLAAQWPMEGGAGFETIVVSDGEDEATRELARGYNAIPVEWVFHERNLGLASARNTGAAKARGDFLLFLDDDTPAAAGLVQFHAQALASASSHADDECDSGAWNEQLRRKRIVVCGRIVESAPNPQGTKTGRFLENAWIETLHRCEAGLRYEEIGRIPADAVQMSCFGLNCSIGRELFHQTGGFNPALRWTERDMELGSRLYMSGVHFVSEPRAVVYHRNAKDMVAYFERCWYLGGSNHVQRAFKLGERNPQTRQLLGLERGPLLTRLANRVFWHANGLVRGLAAALKKLTELTGARPLFSLWQRTAQPQLYWRAVRDAGIRREDLRELAGHPLRVLMLHSIAQPQNAGEASYYLSPDRWRMLLETMKAGGYYCADPTKLLDPAAEWGKRELVLTFDDGYDDFYTEVFPLLESYALRPLLFLPADRIGDENRWDHGGRVRPRKLMGAAQVRELRRHGVRFGSHSLTHPSLITLGNAQLRRELVDSRHKLEDLLGEEVNTFAYPFGANDRRVRAAAIEAGYKVAFTTVEGLNLWEDPLSLRRIEFNQVLPPVFYRWKLSRGHGPRSSVKKELRPLYLSLPPKMKAKLDAIRKH